MALDDARLDARAGQVHAVLGENGAGKTTLLSALAGLIHPDGGTIRIDGREVRLTTPRRAWHEGIGMVHQHFALVDRMTVLDNLALGRRRGGGFRLDGTGLAREARALGRRVGLDVPLDASVESLGVGERQRVEILKVLLRDPSVLVLDEPTAVLAPAEVEGLLALIRRLADEGRAVLLVAHKLDEVLAVAHRFTVLRRGRTVLEAHRDDVDEGILAAAMVGAAPPPLPVRSPAPPADGPPVARLRGVRVGERLRGVDLDVRPGEIVGVAGVEGNGQRELALVLAGRRTPDEGEAHLPDVPAFIPQDRRREGLVEAFSLTENLALGLHRDPAWRRGPWLRWSALRARTAEVMDTFGVRAQGPRARASSLSGGNQQRLVVARELQGRPRLIVAENPTRGLDVAGAAYVHRTLVDRTGGADPAGVVLLSTDLDEVLALADRVLVVVRGRVEAVPPERQTREGVGALMLAGGGADS